MILVSVGTQLPFDRLISAVDEWAFKNHRSDVVAQVGASKYTPRALKCFAMIKPDEFARLSTEACLFVAHAGMGSIISSLDYRKPIIIMPRDHRLGEHRNAHQFATADRFCAMPGVYVARNPLLLVEKLDRMDELVAATSTNASSSPLIPNLRAFMAEAESERPKRLFRRLIR